ncbi:MAG: DUF4055 domain-containing protein, partial [Candidatus Thermoplasmatota archaeon]|nr:DUF4055 domain-containing protein [Candidatus Thermoplasmatota archaeon]
MPVSTKHPDYVKKEKDWTLMDDTYEGQRRIKEKTTEDLPATSSMIEDGIAKSTDPGSKAYAAYLTRAVFHDFVKDAVDGMIGIMHRKPPSIELPEKLRPLMEGVTAEGESIKVLLRRINEAQLKFGRLGLLVEAPTGVGADAIPFIAFYSAMRTINWDDGEREMGRQQLELVVLDETEDVRDGRFEWKNQEKYRVLVLDEGKYGVALVTSGQDKGLPTEVTTPSIAGTELADIPFIFINVNDLVPTPDVPPFLGLANLAVSTYRGEADYRQNLFMQGQDTFVVIGAVDETGLDASGE